MFRTASHSAVVPPKPLSIQEFTISADGRAAVHILNQVLPEPRPRVAVVAAGGIVTCDRRRRKRSAGRQQRRFQSLREHFIQALAATGVRFRAALPRVVQ